MLVTANTALSFCSSENQISFHEIYFRVACASAYVKLQRTDEAVFRLKDALALAVPGGFIMPIAESLTTFQGLLEPLLEREYLTQQGAFYALWESTFPNWLSFHNHFTKDNITCILSMREQEIATMVVDRISHVQIAKHFQISEGRLNNIIKEIYEKLFITSRAELKAYIL